MHALGPVFLASRTPQDAWWRREFLSSFRPIIFAGVALFVANGAIAQGNWSLPSSPVTGTNYPLSFTVDPGGHGSVITLYSQAPGGSTWNSVGGGGGAPGSSYAATGSATFASAGTWTLKAVDGSSDSSPTISQTTLGVAPNTTPTTFTFSNLSHNYDGSSKTATVTPNPANATYTADLTRGPNNGSYTVTATATGNFTGSGSDTLVINPAPTSFSLSSTSFTYNGSAQGPTVLASPSNATYVTGGTLSATGAGNYTATAMAYFNYSGTNNALNWAITKANQTISFVNPGAQTYGTPLTLSASASSGLGVSYSIVSGPANVSGNVISFTATGNVTVRASQGGDANFNAAANVDQTFAVNKGAQTISFGNPGTQTYGTPLTLSATASSGLAVSFSVLSGPASLAGNLLTFTGPGTVMVRAAQSGDGNYHAAPNVDQTFTVNKATPSATFPSRTRGAQTPAGYTVEAADLNAVFNGPAGAATPTGTVTYILVGPNTPVSAGTLLPQAAHTVRASYPGDANYNATTVDATWTVVADSDGDTVPDYIEIALGTNPSAVRQNDTGNTAQLKVHRPN